LRCWLKDVSARRPGSPFSLAGASVTQLALALSAARAIVYGATLLLSAAVQGTKIAADTLVQRAVADTYRGRGWSLGRAAVVACEEKHTARPGGCPGGPPPGGSRPWRGRLLLTRRSNGATGCWL